MTKKVGVRDAKARLPQLLGEVVKGNSITITRRGIPVATLVPATEARPSAAAAVEALRQWRDERRLTLGGNSVREMIEEGRGA